MFDPNETLALEIPIEGDVRGDYGSPPHLFYDMIHTTKAATGPVVTGAPSRTLPKGRAFVKDVMDGDYDNDGTRDAQGLVVAVLVVLGGASATAAALRALGLRGRRRRASTSARSTTYRPRGGRSYGRRSYGRGRRPW